MIKTEEKKKKKKKSYEKAKKISCSDTNIQLRSSRKFKAISFLVIVSVDLLLILDIFSWIIGFFIKVDTMLLESILVIRLLVIVFKWHSETLNIIITLLSTFHKPPRSNISICLCSVQDKFSPEHFPTIKNDKHSC